MCTLRRIENVLWCLLYSEWVVNLYRFSSHTYMRLLINQSRYVGKPISEAFFASPWNYPLGTSSRQRNFRLPWRMGAKMINFYFYRYTHLVNQLPVCVLSPSLNAKEVLSHSPFPLFILHFRNTAKLVICAQFPSEGEKIWEVNHTYSTVQSGRKCNHVKMDR